MGRPRSRHRRLLALGLVLIVAGCSSKVQVTEVPPGKKNLLVIARAYGQATQKLGHSPRSVEELKPFLKDYGNPDKLLVSPNDGKPYAIVAGVNMKNPRGTPVLAYEQVGKTPVLAYEQEGKNGQRQIVDQGMNVRMVTEEEFARLPLPRDHKLSDR